VSEEHFHLLPLAARLLVFRRRCDASGHIARVFMDAASDLAHWRIRTAAFLHRAVLTVGLARPVDDRVGLRDVAARIYKLATVTA
jgi:hypothetical protein